MKKAISFFADENIQEGLIDWLKENSFEVSGIRLENLYGLNDEAIIEKTFLEKKVIITQDTDFGNLIFTRNLQFYAVIFLRPGHHEADFHIPTLKVIFNHFFDKIKEGSIIIGVRNNDDIKVRFRLITYTPK